METKITVNEIRGLIARAGHGQNKIPLNFSGYDFSGMDLNYLDLSGARFYLCDMDNTLIYYTDLRGAIFEDCYFCNMRWADIHTNKTNGASLVFTADNGRLELNPASKLIEDLLTKDKTEKDVINPLEMFPGATVEYFDYDTMTSSKYKIPHEYFDYDTKKSIKYRIPGEDYEEDTGEDNEEDI